MLFLTVILFALTLIGIVKGGLFHESKVKIGELNLKKEAGEISKETHNAELKPFFPILLSMTALAVIEVIYYFFALSIDTYKYPTIIMILIMIILIASGERKSKRTIEEKRKRLQRKYTFKFLAIELFSLAYYGYMFYLMMF